MFVKSGESAHAIYQKCRILIFNFPHCSKTFPLEMFCMCEIYQKCRHVAFNFLLNPLPHKKHFLERFFENRVVNIIIIIILHF